MLVLVANEQPLRVSDANWAEYYAKSSLALHKLRRSDRKKGFPLRGS